ncbi:MAG: hydrogenase maturation protease [Spirochaetales bacterium]|nr:hydrogenase maturation protease [Spirochaetales bacterium]
MKTIILGVGNPILGDDGAGIHAAREVKKYIDGRNIKVEEAITGGMNLLDLILGYDRAIIIDAVKSEDAQEGDVRRIPLAGFKTIHSCNPHGISLIEAIEMVKKIGDDRVPGDIVIIGIMMKHIPCEFGEKLSTPVVAAIPKAVELVLDEIKSES